MFISLKLDQEYTIGTVVQYDTTVENWITAATLHYPVGVVKSAEQDDDQKWITRIVIAGAAYALAAESISDQGGFLEVENGAVKISSAETVGVISPKTLGESNRIAGSLVMVNLR